MSIFTDWLIAKEDEAPAVASIVTTEERSYDDWPAICLQGIGEMELQALAEILRRHTNADRSTLGELLYRGSEEGPFVAAVRADFIDLLASLTDQSMDRVAADWRSSEHLRAWASADILRTLASMTLFARRAQELQTPVLQLMTL